ncbi:hypothetical protein U1707_15475 [Sphingomonas sp. PB2P12]|uniref:DUF3617 domain-containing protein n=1 Tax=Sphingomonas sandaracina TaxID=3096157 RepID=UPI002FCBC63A
MIKYAAVALLLASPAAAADLPTVAAERWDITSTVVELSLPGVPGFIVRMMRGKSKAERKRVASGVGIDALLVPDPKAQCRVDGQRVADGHYVQALTCPQKSGKPLAIARTGTYDATGFVGRAIVTGVTPKGPMRIVLDQRAVHTGK